MNFKRQIEFELKQTNNANLLNGQLSDFKFQTSIYNRMALTMSNKILDIDMSKVLSLR